MIERIQALDITKQYNARFELSCSLEIKKGPLYTIVGPNGSGKSTLLRILSFIEQPDSGQVIYHNNDMSMSHLYNNTEIRRKMVLVPSRAALFNETVFNNAAYGLRLRRIQKSICEDRAAEALKEVGLAGKENMNALKLSSGEAQRLALARAFAINPDILFLDEPTVSLDPDNTRQTEEIITEWRSQSDKITVMVTHSLPQAKTLSDVVMFMFNGNIPEISASRNFFDKPATEMARKFVFGEVY